MTINKDPQKYHGMKYRIYFVGLSIDIILLLMLIFSGSSFAIKNFAYALTDHALVGNAIYVAVLSLIFYIVHLPLSIFLGFTWEHKFGLSNQSMFDWLRDDIKKSALSLCLSIVLAVTVYWFLGRFTTTWWMAAGCFWLFLSFVLAKLTPTVIVPMFYKYTDINNDPLKKRIRELFKSCKTSLKDVYAIDFSSKTKKANAFICGIGKSRRVVLSDTLLSEFEDEEIEAVVAHELGHYCHRDILKLLTINSVSIFLGLYLVDKILKWAIPYFGYSGLDDIASLPLMVMCFSVFGFVLTPIMNWYSCRMETAADQFCLQMTGNSTRFISMMHKLGQLNLAEFEPNRLIEIFFYDHPPIKKRIEFARTFQMGT